MNDGDHNVNRRLGHLEQGLSRVEAKQEAQEHTLGQLARGVAEISTKLDSRSQTDWKTIIAGVALTVTIGGLALAPMNSRITGHSVRLNSLMEKIISHKLEEGHLPMRIRVGKVEREAMMLDEALQREMRLLDGNIMAQLDQMDVRLQREMDLKDALERQRIDKIEREQERRTNKVYKE